MNIIQILFISIGLAMDAFAISICKGLCIKSLNKKKIIKVSLYFGIFQAIMPIIGYFIGDLFDEILMSIDHWIVFVLLVIIGANTILETLSNKNETLDDDITFSSMLLPSLATSIDALAVGFTFAFLKVNIWLSSIVIGIVAFVFTSIGVIIGNKVGNKYENKSKILGGLILIIIAIKILIEHLS